jgi:hypothetical protein
MLDGTIVKHGPQSIGKPLVTPTSSNSIGTPKDYSSDLYRVYFEVGDHDGSAKEIMVSFLTARSQDDASFSFSSDLLRTYRQGYEVDVSMQLIPELVRELATNNVAIYQVVRIHRL